MPSVVALASVPDVYKRQEKYSPELLDKGTLSEKKGISCLLINNNIGEKMLSEYGIKLVVYPVEVSKVMILNTQLKEPTKYTQKRQRLLKRFRDNGYSLSLIHI